MIDHLLASKMFDGLQPGEFENFLLRAGAMLTIAVLILTFVALWRGVFGRKPPIDDDLKEVRQALTGLAPKPVVDKLVEQLGSYASKADIEELKKQLSHYITRDEFNRRIEEWKVVAEKTEIYLHKSMHELRDRFQVMMTGAELRDHTLAALDERTVIQTRTMDGLSNKLDKVVERLADKVEDIIRTGGRRK